MIISLYCASKSGVIPVRQKPLALLAKELLHGVLAQVVVVVQVPEDGLRHLGLLRGRGSTELVERDVEPLVDAGVQRVVLVADLKTSKKNFLAKSEHIMLVPAQAAQLSIYFCERKSVVLHLPEGPD